MAAPTQELPSWLTYVATTITDDDGNVATSSTLVYLPLTYYGPSIPLGPDWTYGGLTSPAEPTATATEPSSTEPPTTATATPTISTAIPSSTSASAIPSSISNTSSSLSSPSSSYSTSTSQESPTQTASETSTPSPSGGLERGQLVGIIVGSILAAIAIFLLFLICCLKRRRQQENRRSPSQTPELLDEWQIAHRSPNGRGGEADPFLADTAVAGPSRPRGSRAVPVNDDSMSSGSNQSGYGTLLENPSLTMRPSFEEDRYSRQVPPWQLRTLEEEESVPPSDDGHEFGVPTVLADVPPRLVGAQQSQRSFQSKRTQRSSYPIDGDEPATLETARRVRLDGPRTSPETHSLPLEEPEADSSRRGARSSGVLGLTALANLGRFSWFKGWDSSSRRSSRADRDLEASDALLGDAPPSAWPGEMIERRRSRLGAGLGLTAEGDRPISSVSAKSGTSGGTVYHDANSSLSSPGTPVLTPPPRAFASTNQAEMGVRWSLMDSPKPSRQHSQTELPASPSTNIQPTPSASQTLSHTLSDTLTSASDTVDILDTPAPKGISPFGSTTAVHLNSESQPVHQVSVGPLPSPVVWTQTMGTTPPAGSLAARSEGSTQVGGSHRIAADVLEEEPPAPTDTWKSMASIIGPSLGGPRNRTTFGLPRLVQQPDLVSEQGSLHTMRSYLSPTSSNRSTGSAPASRREGNSSGSSGLRSRSPTSGSSLAHSGSISSDGRRRHGDGPVSPTLSAFGHHSRPVSPPERAHLSDVDAVHGVPVDRRQDPLDESMSPPLSPLLLSPWIGGLDEHWQAM